MAKYSCMVLLGLCSLTTAQDGQYALNITSLTVDIPLGSGNFVTQDLTIPPNISLPINENYVRYYLYTNRLNGTQISKDNVTSVNFNATKETIFMVHGWTASYQSESSQEVKDAYLKSRDFNVILVDWIEISKRDYVNARYAVQKIGDFMASFILFMIKNVDLDLNKTGLVGHSLGAHVCGAAGNVLNGSVNRIIGLDPAGPLFLLAPSTDKLESGDAKFVEVIHTCAGILGYPFSLGNSDYWPNGGVLPQPGCSVLEQISCSHSRSYRYYSESLVGGKFVANECGNYVSYKLGSCRKADEALMGNDAIDRSTGNFFLNTNKEEPYAQD